MHFTKWWLIIITFEPLVWFSIFKRLHSSEFINNLNEMEILWHFVTLRILGIPLSVKQQDYPAITFSKLLALIWLLALNSGVQIKSGSVITLIYHKICSYLTFEILKGPKRKGLVIVPPSVAGVENSPKKIPKNILNEYKINMHPEKI